MYEIPGAKDSTGNMEHCAESNISKTELSIHCDCAASVSLISTGCFNCCPWEILKVNPAHNHAFIVTIWGKLVSVKVTAGQHITRHSIEQKKLAIKHHLPRENQRHLVEVMILH